MLLNVLLLNQEEAAFLSQLPSEQEKETIKKIAGFCSGIVIITKAEQGALVFDGHRLFRAAVLPVKVVERTGAGDAFSSGFLASWIYERGDIKRAMSWGSANAGNVILYFGANKGLLRLNEIKRKINDVIVNNLIEEKPV